MGMQLSRFSLRELRRRPARALLTLLSVAIGVAMVVAISLGSSTVRSAYRQLYETLAGRAALEVVAQGGGSFDQGIIGQLRETPGVRDCIPVVRRPGLAYLRHKRFRVLLLGVDPVQDRLVRDYELQSGAWFGPGRSAMLPSDFAAAMGISPGDEVNLLTRKGLQTFVVAGLLGGRSASASIAGSAFYITLDQAQRLFVGAGQVDAIDLLLDRDSQQQDVEAELSRRLPPGLFAHPPAARSDFSRETLLSIDQGMNFAAVLSLVAAAIIVLNALFMNVGERRRQLGILRAIGATRRQVIMLILREGLILGLLGAALGLLVGLAGARALSAALAQLFQANLPPPHLTAQAAGLAFLVGPGISLVSAYFPARYAAQIPPVEAMHAVRPGDPDRLPRWPTWIGLGVLAAFGLASTLSARGLIPANAGTALSAVGLAGFMLLIPAAIARVSGPLAHVFYCIAGFEAELAVRQLRRRPLRTSLTVAVLFVALVLGIGLGNTLLSNIADIRQWYRQTIVGDYFLRATMPDIGTGLAAEMPESLREDIGRIPGVAGVEMVRFLRAQAQGQPVIVVARSFSPDLPAPLHLASGDPRRIVEQLARGEVAIGSVLAQRAGVQPGGWITVDTRRGPAQLHVAGTANDYTVGGMVVYMDIPTARRLFEVQGVDVFLIQSHPTSKPEVGDALRTFADQRGLLLQSFGEVGRLVDRTIAGVVAGIWALLALSFAIAAFGVANTLSMNILEQTRELGLLRSVGMTRGQLRKMILSQAVAVAIVSLVPGALVGLGMAYLVNLASAPLLGYAIRFEIHIELLLGCLAAALAVVIAVAWLPAERAARLMIPDAVQYE